MRVQTVIGITEAVTSIIKRLDKTRAIERDGDIIHVTISFTSERDNRVQCQEYSVEVLELANGTFQVQDVMEWTK